MAPKEFSVLDQKSSHVFDLIGESINKPQFIHLCLNILLLLGQEFGVRMFPEFESVPKYLLSSERLSILFILPMQVLDYIHAARAAAVGAINLGKLTRCSLLSRLLDASL